MLDTCSTARTEPHLYQAFGFTLRSPLALPLPAGASPADVEILYAPIPENLDAATHAGIRYQARPGQLMFKVDRVARYWISEGRRIVIARDPDATDDDVRLFLLGSAFGALLHQRGMFALHGSAVVAAGRALAFIGASGAGKSTLAMAFAKRGLGLLSDDVCVVKRGTDGALQALPGCRDAKLWVDSLQQLDIAPGELRKVRSSLAKRVLPLEALAAEQPAPLTHIYVLRPGNQANVTLEHVLGPRKFLALRKQTYRLQFADALGMREVQFQQVLELAQQARIAIACRPLHPFRLTELIDCIAADCSA